MACQLFCPVTLLLSVAASIECCHTCLEHGDWLLVDDRLPWDRQVQPCGTQLVHPLLLQPLQLLLNLHQKMYDIKRLIDTFHRMSFQSCVAADDVVQHGSCGCCCCCSRKPKHSVLGPRAALHVNPPYDGASCSAFQPADGSRRAAVRIVLSSAVKVNKCCAGFAAHLLVLTNSHVASLEPFQGTVTTASLTVAARTASGRDSSLHCSVLLS